MENVLSKTANKLIVGKQGKIKRNYFLTSTENSVPGTDR